MSRYGEGKRGYLIYDGPIAPVEFEIGSRGDVGGSVKYSSEPLRDVVVMGGSAEFGKVRLYVDPRAGTMRIERVRL